MEISTATTSADLMPRQGDTYFWNGRPVTVMRVTEGMALVRAGNINRKLDFWVTWSELS